MRRSTERFLTTHVGSLVRPPEIADAIRAGGARDMDARVSRAVRDVVRKQAEIGIDVVSDGEAFLPAVAPGTIEGQRPNEHYKDSEAYLFAIADAMAHEYRAIVDAGFVLQVDDPRTAVMYDLQDPAPTPQRYREFVELRLAALARALKGRSEEHTSELQSRRDLVCRLLLEKKKKNTQYHRKIPCMP